MQTAISAAQVDHETLRLADLGDACPACTTTGLVAKVTRPGLPAFLCQACGHRFSAHDHFPRRVAA